MTAVEKHSKREPRRGAFRPPAERRRALLALILATGLLIALGVSLAAADPSLKDQIDSARSNAGQLSDRITAQTNRIGSLTEHAHQAGAQAMVVAAQVEQTETRAQELAAELRAAEAKLARLRAQYAAALNQLEDRLVSIYESDSPDELTVLLNSNGFDDLATRSAYLDALHDADRRIATRVASLRDQVADHVHQVADLRQQADDEAEQLTAARASLVSSQQSANQAAAAVSTARSHTEGSLSETKGQIADLQQQIEAQRAAVGTGAGAPAYLGGPYSIPTYIVMCESGGNYHALNSSSGAGGAYQILPSTWRAYGGQGAPQDAPKEEQDRIAAEIWRDSGPSAWACA
jgi:septal ring factor EnvC (AmiA/AmiB activator)